MANNGLSGTLLPVHFKPKNDELLSSWICRLALGHGLQSASFCWAVLPRRFSRQRATIQDIDRHADKEVISVLAKKTGTARERVVMTTLAAYEGFLFERWNPKGKQIWVMPINSSPPREIIPGLQYCPLCLSEGEPYYRRTWRLAFATLCTEHYVHLLDQCMRCGAPISFHKAISNGQHKPPSDKMTFCYFCKVDLRKAKAKLAECDEVSFQRCLERALREGWIEISESRMVHSLLYFPVLHHLMRLLAVGERGLRLRESLSRRYDINMFDVSFTKARRELAHLTTSERRGLVLMARHLLTNWPYDFFDFCSANRLLGYELMGRMKPIPFWFWSAIREYLDQVMYKPYKYHPDGTAITYRVKSKF